MKQKINFQMRETSKGLNRPVESPQTAVYQPSRVFVSLWHKIITDGQVRYIVAFLAGLLIGLVVLGWYLWPVEWTDATFATLGEREKAALVDAAAELNAYDLGSPTAQRLVDGWNSVDVACRTAFAVANPDRKTRILYLVYLSGADCESQERLAGFGE